MAVIGFANAERSVANNDITSVPAPNVRQDPSCGPGTHTIYAGIEEDYFDYTVRFYTQASGGSPVHTVIVPANEYEVAYQVYLTTSRDYWVSVTMNGQTSSRTYFRVLVGSKPYAYGDGYSCTVNQASVQLGATTSVSAYFLYRRVGTNYHSVGSNATGLFNLTNFVDSDATNYYARVRSPSGCYSDYSTIDFEVVLPDAPAVSGAAPRCDGTSSTLAARGGSTAGNYRWYDASDNLLSASNAQVNTGTMTSNKVYYVSYFVSSDMGQCESPKRQVAVTVNNPSPPSVQNKTACDGDNVTLTASSGYSSYQWFLNGSNTAAHQSTTNSYSRPASGVSSYRVSGIIGGCTTAKSN